VTRVLHLSALLHLPLVLSARRDQLGHLEHGLGQLIEVAATHDVDLSSDHAHLDGLEVVGEISSRLYHIGAHGLRFGVVKEETARVFFDYVNHQIAYRLHYRDRGCCLDDGCSF